jgi:hypothetical protein
VSLESRPRDDAVAVRFDQAKLDQHVGHVVTIRGIQTRSKIPKVGGVDVDGPYKYSDRLVTATGVLHRGEIKAEDVYPFAANRGPGTFYSLTDPSSGELAKTHLVIPEPMRQDEREDSRSNVMHHPKVKLFNGEPARSNVKPQILISSDGDDERLGLDLSD